MWRSPKFSLWPRSQIHATPWSQLVLIVDSLDSIPSTVFSPNKQFATPPTAQLLSRHIFHNEVYDAAGGGCCPVQLRGNRHVPHIPSRSTRASLLLRQHQKHQGEDCILLCRTDTELRNDQTDSDEAMANDCQIQVQSGGSFDIDYEVADPNGKIVLSGEKERQGDFAFTAQVVGDYSFCFSNQMSTFTEKYVDLDIAVRTR